MSDIVERLRTPCGLREDVNEIRREAADLIEALMVCYRAYREELEVDEGMRPCIARVEALLQEQE